MVSNAIVLVVGATGAPIKTEVTMNTMTELFEAQAALLYARPLGSGDAEARDAALAKLTSNERIDMQLICSVLAGFCGQGPTAPVT